jgi:predicted kinase
MATVHLVHGFLCCGKTTFAKALERRTGGVRISLDKWLVALTGDPVRLEPELVERVHALTLQLWPEFVLRGIDVILDFGFWRRRHRDEVRRKAASVGAASHLYWVRCPDEVARERCRERNTVRVGAYHISDEGFAEMRSRFEPLDPDEEHELIET